MKRTIRIVSPFIELYLYKNCKKVLEQSPEMACTLCWLYVNEDTNFKQDFCNFHTIVNNGK